MVGACIFVWPMLSADVEVRSAVMVSLARRDAFAVSVARPMAF